MQAIKRPTLGKLFDNKFFTYQLNNEIGASGKVVEVEMIVVGKRIIYKYKDIRERKQA